MTDQYPQITEISQIEIERGIELIEVWLQEATSIAIGERGPFLFLRNLCNLRIMFSPAVRALLCCSCERRQTRHLLFESFAGNWTSIRYVAVG